MLIIHSLKHIMRLVCVLIVYTWGCILVFLQDSTKDLHDTILLGCTRYSQLCTYTVRVPTYTEIRTSQDFEQMFPVCLNVHVF